MRDPEFSFTITDAARFLDKSPVTLRKWEQQGFYTFSRVGTDRRLSCLEVRELARHARSNSRISESRLKLIEATLTLLEMIEKNESSDIRSTGRRKEQASPSYR